MMSSDTWKGNLREVEVFKIICVVEFLKFFLKSQKHPHLGGESLDFVRE